MFDRAVSEGPFRTEYTLLDDRTLELSFNPIRQGDRAVGISIFGKDISAGKAAEKAVRQAEAKYRDIFVGALEGIFRTSIEGRAITANPALAKMLGYDSPEEGVPAVTDAAIQVWLDPNDRLSFLNLLQDKKVVLGYECQLKRKDGRAVWVSINSRIVSDVSGTALYIEGFVEEITERKRAEAAIQQAHDAIAKAERQYRHLFNSVSDAVLVYELREDGLLLPGRYLEVNDNACRLLGYTREELLQLRVTDIVSPEERFAGPANALKLLADGQLMWSGLIVTKSGRRIPVEANTHIFDLDGSSLAISSLRDISERKEVEKALRESREQLRLFVEHTPAPIAMFDRQMRYLAYSGRWTNDYGLNDQDLIGRSHYDVFPEMPQRWKQIHQRCLSGAVERCDEDVFPRANGSVDWIRWEIHPWCNGKGEIGGIIIFTENISDRKRSEAQLMQAQKMESVGRLAGGVAHDFNNLLTVINGYSSFLLSGLNADDPLRSYAEEIATAGERAAGLTRQLLAFSRKQVIEPKPLDLNAIVRESAAMLRRLIGDDIVLETHLDSLLGQVMADPDQIHQVIMNLTVNARDAMPDGGAVDIETQNVEVEKENGTAGHLDHIPRMSGKSLTFEI
jgi:PAS domain S-box-containing protein